MSSKHQQYIYVCVQQKITTLSIDKSIDTECSILTYLPVTRPRAVKCTRDEGIFVSICPLYRLARVRGVRLWRTSAALSSRYCIASFKAMKRHRWLIVILVRMMLSYLFQYGDSKLNDASSMLHYK